jgi:catechol 2,3-dioxygenase-like lactoylglutathione lyase family enzyme
MRALGLDHVSVTVNDIDRSLVFYHELLGLPILGRGEEKGTDVARVTGLGGAHFRYADLDLGSGQILELLQYLYPRGTPLKQSVHDPGSGHLALRVDDIQEVLRRMNQAGVSARSEPVTLEEPLWWQGATCVYVTDPDGVTVELVERTSRK